MRTKPNATAAKNALVNARKAKESPAIANVDVVKASSVSVSPLRHLPGNRTAALRKPRKQLGLEHKE